VEGAGEGGGRGEAGAPPWRLYDIEKGEGK